MKLVFDEKDMIDFVKWYDGQNEESLGRTFEEDFNTWKTLKINTCAICSDCKNAITI